MLPSKMALRITSLTLLWRATLVPPVLSVAWAAPAPAPAAPTFLEPNAQLYKKAPGPYAVTTLALDWHDDARGRDVPVRLYQPQGARTPLPVILFSHGLGGSRDGYEYLGRHWASHGYFCLHLQHHGSDSALFKNQPQPVDALRRAAADPRNALNRAQDVHFTLDQLARLNREDPACKGKLDLERVGMASLTAARTQFGPHWPGSDPRQSPGPCPHTRPQRGTQLISHPHPTSRTPNSTGRNAWTTSMLVRQ